MAWSEADLLAFELRQKRVQSAPPAASDAVPAGQEDRLQDEIAADLVRRGWLFVRSRMDMATTVRKGTVDFIIAMPGGITLWVECKTATGKMTPEQLGVKLMLERLGHRHAVVRSMREFLAVVTPWLSAGSAGQESPGSQY